MKKNRITSVLKVVSILVNVPIFAVNSILYVITLTKKNEINSLFLYISIISFLVIFFILIINYLFSIIGKKKLFIGKGYIIYMNTKYIISEDTRLVYTRISLDSILDCNPGDLTLILDNKPIRLGWYFKTEINRMSQNIHINQEYKLK